MEADANMRELLGLTKGTTSEECYRICRDNIPSEYTEKVDNCVKKLWKKDMLTSFIRGTIRLVEKSGSDVEECGRKIMRESESAYVVIIRILLRTSSGKCDFEV